MFNEKTRKSDFVMSGFLSINYRIVFSLFWDLFSAAPERRDTCEASQEAKAFHEYVRFFFH